MARILYVSQGYNTHDRRFLGKLAATNHEVWFLPCGVDPVPLEEQPIPAGIKHLNPLSKGNQPRSAADWIVAYSRFRRHLRRIRPDLVHAGPVQTGAFLAALNRAAPLLVMSWGSDVLVAPDRNRWSGWMTRFTLRRAQMVLSDCLAVRDRVLELSGLREDQMVLLPFGVELTRFRRKPSALGLREKLGWQNCRVILSTRSFEQSHGTFVFLEGIRQVLQAQPQARVLMLGDGSLKNQVVSFVERNGLRDKIHLAGQVRQDLLPDYFNEADLYVSAAFSDGSSISLLEAMACGLPVIVADCYGNREWVTHGVNGWLTPPGKADLLAETVLEALGQEGRLSAMREANQAVVRERADWERNFSRLLEAYDKLLGTPQTSREIAYA